MVIVYKPEYKTRTPKKFLATCEHCGTVFIFEDTEIVRSKMITRNPTTLTHINCPTCENTYYCPESRFKEITDDEYESILNERNMKGNSI